MAPLPQHDLTVLRIHGHIQAQGAVHQPLRQRMFDTQATTDDHVMHIVGTAVDSLGNSYYKVKNSWGERAGRHGYWYASPAYVAGKTIELVLPRAALGVDPGDDAFRIER